MRKSVAPLLGNRDQFATTVADCCSRARWCSHKVLRPSVRIGCDRNSSENRAEGPTPVRAILWHPLGIDQFLTKIQINGDDGGGRQSFTR